MNNTINTANLRLVQVNTTAYEEEDMLLITTLTDEQIESVVTPIVERERESVDFGYINNDLAEALRIQFPTAIVLNYDPSDVDLINI
jgi:uncharacterized protein YpuA (DUF1002 family)